MFEPKANQWPRQSFDVVKGFRSAGLGVLVGSVLGAILVNTASRARVGLMDADALYRLGMFCIFESLLLVMHRWWIALRGHGQAVLLTLVASSVLMYAWCLSDPCFGAFCCGPNERTVEVEVVMLEGAVEMQQIRNHGRMPRSMRALLDGGVIKKLKRDAWGQSYRLEFLDNDEAHICSAGPDRLFDTHDDICSEH